MFTARVHLEDLAVDPQLLYDGNQRLSKFTYVQRILTLNKSAVLMLHNLEQFVLSMLAPLRLLSPPKTMQVALLKGSSNRLSQTLDSAVPMSLRVHLAPRVGGVEVSRV